MSLEVLKTLFLELTPINDVRRLVTGKDPETGETANRWWAGASIAADVFSGGVGKVGDAFKAAKAIDKLDDVADVTKVADKADDLADTAKTLDKADDAKDVGKVVKADSSFNSANYAQKTYRAQFSKEGQNLYSKLAGQKIETVDDLSEALKTGKIDPKQLPIDYIKRDGNSLILNTRTSQALDKAGVPRSQWYIRDRTGNRKFESLLDGQLKRNKLDATGIETVRPSNGGK